MEKGVTIRDVIFVQGQGVRAAVVALGLVLDNGDVAWGDCIGVGGISAETLITTIRTHIVPLYKGRTLADWREASAELDTLSETVHFVEEEQPPAPEGVTRRNLFRVDFSEQLPEPIVREWDEIRPISAAVRYGASQALLNAFALANALHPVQVVCATYGLRVPDTPVPIHAMLHPRQLNAAQRLLAYKVGSLGIAFNGENPEVELGKKGEFAQRAVRHVRDAALAIGPPHQFEPVIYIDLAGGYEAICEGNLGKMLGNLSGLDSSAKPHTVWVEDPVAYKDRATQLEKMKGLAEFLQLRRKMRVRLVARRHVTDLASVAEFVAHKAANYLVLDPLTMGGFHAVVDGFMQCKAAGIGVIIGGNSAETSLSAELSAAVALAIQPARVLAKPASQVGVVTVGNAMRRTLAQLRYAN